MKRHGHLLGLVLLLGLNGPAGRAAPVAWVDVVGSATNIGWVHCEELVSISHWQATYRSAVVTNAALCRELLAQLMKVKDVGVFVQMDGSQARCSFQGGDGRTILTVSVNLDRRTVSVHNRQTDQSAAVLDWDVARRVLDFVKQAPSVSPRVHDLRDPAKRPENTKDVLAAFAATETPLFLIELHPFEDPEENIVQYVYVSRCDTTIDNQFLTFKWGRRLPRGCEVFYSTLVRYYAPAGIVVPKLLGMGCRQVGREEVVELHTGYGRQFYVLTQTGMRLIRLEDREGRLLPISFSVEDFRLGDIKQSYDMWLPSVDYVLQTATASGFADTLETLSWLGGDFVPRNGVAPHSELRQVYATRSEENQQQEVDAVIRNPLVQARLATLATNEHEWIRDAATNLILRARRGEGTAEKGRD